jgi:phosphate transport system permease protein
MSNKKENIYKWIFSVLAYSSLIFLLGITIVLFKEGLPVFKEVGIIEFIAGRDWYPTDEANPDYGILPLIMGSVWVVGGALVVCVPLGVGRAHYVH